MNSIRLLSSRYSELGFQFRGYFGQYAATSPALFVYFCHKCHKWRTGVYCKLQEDDIDGVTIPTYGILKWQRKTDMLGSMQRAAKSLK